MTMDARDSKGVQYGQSNVQNNLFVSQVTSPTWPQRVGAIPRVADCFQSRPAETFFTAAPDSGQKVPSTLILSGLGGVGKTQVAANFARSQWQSGAVDLLVWVEASSKDAVVTGFAQAAIAISIDDGSDPSRAASRFLAWQEDTDKRWLIVLDDLQNPADLQDMWPIPSLSGRVIVTTRRQDSILSAAGRKLVTVHAFTEEEAANYLADKFGSEPARLIEADKLASDLGHLPLALAQAAAYMADRELDCADYRRRWNDRSRRIQELTPEDGALPDNHRRTVAATWSLSVDFADRLSPQGVARPLLELASVLDANGIPAPILSSQPALSYIAGAPASPSGRPVDRESAEDALHNLRRLSLISIDSHGALRRVRMHSLAQRAVRESLSEERQGQLAKFAADAVLEVWSGAERDRDFSQLLRTNARSIYDQVGKFLWEPRAHELIFRAGSSLSEAGLIAAAIPYWSDVYDCARRMLGDDHP
jgi:hypothetical protein